MSKNLVLGAAFGYDIEKVKPFVLSLRRHYDGIVVFVVDNVSDSLASFYEEHNIYTYVPDSPVNRGYGNVDRFRYYLDCLENFEDVDNVMLSDIRDVIFQSNPFAEYPKHDIELFAEPEVFGKCSHNGPWYNGLYGAEQLDKIKDEHVLCAGTTLGKFDTIVQYITILIEEIVKLEDAGKAHGTCDQAVHNHIVYTGRFADYRINQNGEGLVSTMHHSKTLTFDRQGRMLNNDGNPTPVVHQYDRCGPMSVVFLKNALGLTGKEIRTAAEYAANNFFEHDLG
jgi:hypothetical protein